MRVRPAARWAVLILALLVPGWYVIAIRQAQSTDRASALISPGARLGASQAQHASSLLDAAGFLNPDRAVDVLRAQLRTDQGDFGGARRILLAIVRAEPKNVQAWLALARASVGDLRHFYAAAYAIHHLIPPVPAPH